MSIAGIKWWLLYLLVVRSLTHSCRAFSTAPKQARSGALCHHSCCSSIAEMCCDPDIRRSAHTAGWFLVCLLSTATVPAACWAMLVLQGVQQVMQYRSHPAQRCGLMFCTVLRAVQVQLPALDPAKQFSADFRMQATSYAAHMIVRDYQTVRSSSARQQDSSQQHPSLANMQQQFVFQAVVSSL